MAAATPDPSSAAPEDARSSRSEVSLAAAPAALTRPARSVRPLVGLLPFLRPYRGRLALGAACLALAAASTLALPWALRSLIDRGLVAADPAQRVMVVRDHFFALFAVGVAVGVFSAGRIYMVTWISERVAADLRDAVYAHLVRQSPQFFETAQTGEVVSRLITDTTLIQTSAGAGLSMGLRSSVVAFGAIVMLILTSPYVMLQVLVTLLVVVVPAVLIGRRVRKLSRDSQDRVADASAIAAEVINAITVVQSYTQEARETRRFAAATERAFVTAIRRTRLRAGLFAFIVSAVFGALLWSVYEGTQAVMRGELSPGHLGQTVVYAFLLVANVGVLAEVYGELLRAAGATERLLELLAAVPTIVEPESPQALLPVTKGASVRFERVTFRYPSRPDQAALSCFELEVKPGETVALVGPSGAGKSTVLQLLVRFYDVTTGQITFDGVPLRAASLQSVRDRIGVVPQDSVMFSADALENIRYGRPDATEAEVIAAAKAAFAHDFILALPAGYHTFLGERGLRLSGGQRQRISIARAILKNPPLLLLDEATSALDTESERSVQAALEQAMNDRTTIVIAHRLSTVQRADRIVVMEGGRIVDTGSHAALMVRDGLYSRLASLQLTAGVAGVL
jgi:ATP-binding cassette subfamily B protein